MPAKTYAIGVWFDELYTVKFQKKAGKLVLVSHDFPETFKVYDCVCDGLHITGSEYGKDLNLRITNYAVTGRHFFLSFRSPEDKIYYENHYTLSGFSKPNHVIEVSYREGYYK